MQVIVTLAGRGQRFVERGYKQPKAAIPVGGRSAISYLIETFPKEWSLILVMGEHDRASNLEGLIKNQRPDAKIIYSNYSDRGPIDTVLRALPFLRPAQGIIVTYCDVAVVWRPDDFAAAVKNYDMASVNYQGFHPTYLGPNSYCHVKVDSQAKQVTQFQEKQLFTQKLETEITSAGIYYFKNKDLLEKALAAQLEQKLRHGKEYYVSLALQALLNLKQNFTILNYPVDHLLQVGTPEDIERFEIWLGYFRKKEYPEGFSSQERIYWEQIFQHFKVV